MPAFSAPTLIQSPSFALNDILLPFHHTSLTKHGYHYHFKQNLSTSSFRVHSTNGKAPAPATTTTGARLSLPAYLTETLGLSEANALSASRYLLSLGYGNKQGNVNTFVTIKKAGDAISYLQNDCELHLSLSQIKKLVARYPKILLPGAHLKKTSTPNITLLQNDFGLTKEKVLEVMLKYPGAFLIKTEILKGRLVKIEDKWGISRDSAAFLRAIPVLGGATYDKIEKRCQVFKSFGWSDSDILRMVRTSPICIAYSEARLRKSLEFCINELGYEPAELTTRSPLLTMGVETRLLPRHRVLSLLKENLFVKSSYQLYSCIMLPDHKFEEKFILPYEKLVPNIRQVYNEGRTPDSGAESHEEVSEDDTESLVDAE